MRSIIVSSRSGPKSVGSEGIVIGGDSGSDINGSGSKLNMPSGVPSDTCPSETLEGDVLGVVIFGFSVWGAEINDGGVSEVCNCEGDGVDGICWCWWWCDKISETWGLYVTGSIMGDLGGGGSKIGSEGLEMTGIDWEVRGGWIGKILLETTESEVIGVLASRSLLKAML